MHSELTSVEASYQLEIFPQCFNLLKSFGFD